jgi:hypothetical protein
MAIIGYFEGTDSLLLAKLAAEGFETIPVANLSDGHGKYVSYLNKGDVNVVVGPFHKVIPAEPERTAMFSLMLDNLLSAAKVKGIPFLLSVPPTHVDKAKTLLGDRANVHIVTPDDLESQIRKYL